MGEKREIKRWRRKGGRDECVLIYCTKYSVHLTLLLWFGRNTTCVSR